MSFGLKNAGATYQRVMSIIFRDHLRKMVEFYVDDIAVKSRSKSNHLADLRTVFNIMRAHQLKMNLTKSFLGVLSGKFLRYCHIQRDSPWPQQSQGHSEHTISEDPQKAQRSLQGTHLYPEIHYKSFGSLPIVHMVNEEGCLLCMGWSLPKGFWGCQGVPHQASGPGSYRFREIVLALCAQPMDHSLGALLAQKNDESFEHAIYYLSRTLIVVESRYNSVKKECLALVFAVQKTRHYLVAKPYVSFQESIPCTFSWRSWVFWTLD